ncbi:MAG TPA: transcriptional repressor NrdR [Candidatus Latescibacteria bacterium]|nr:transcriptional repressor NrdR [Candidatus Latescibacterota bacterium]
MKCPYCGSLNDKVVDSRASKEGTAIRRRRECLDCKQRFTTYEYIEGAALTVVKANGRREPFDRQKLFNGINIACNKRPVSREEIDQMVEEIEAELYDLDSKEVSSKKIGELVMKRLKILDEVAYVRFASVYRKFKDKTEFMEELKQLLK